MSVYTSSGTAAPSAHPDLLHLLGQGEKGVERYACIVLAMLWGWKWERGPRLPTGVWLLSPDRRNAARYDDLMHGHFHRALPNPLADTKAGRAAAWELETRALVRWVYDREVHCFAYEVKPHAIMYTVWGPDHPNRQRAAVLAVLEKHAEGNLSHLIRPLLDKMTEEPV